MLAFSQNGKLLALVRNYWRAIRERSQITITVVCQSRLYDLTTGRHVNLENTYMNSASTLTFANDGTLYFPWWFQLQPLGGRHRQNQSACARAFQIFGYFSRWEDGRRNK